MKKIFLLDCTLRDGGCVNNFNFGTNYMQQILDNIENANIDIIECGYIDEKNGTVTGRTQFVNEQVITQELLKNKKTTTKYVAMIDYGKFDVNNLQQRSESTIDGIRLAFHKKDKTNMVKWARIILDKGYDLYIQPMLIMRYTDFEILELIDIVNRELYDTTAFYIVDSFGEMRNEDVQRVQSIIEHNLNKNIKIGFHSHNNLQLSYSNACKFVEFKSDRDAIVDVSVLGMGKGAGNLNSEIFAEHMNLYYKAKYNIAPLLYVIDNVLNQIREDYKWGYSIESYLSSINHCTPSYSSFLYQKHTLTIDEINNLLKRIPEEKRISFNREFINDMYYEYYSSNYNDKESLKKLKSEIGKNVLLIAPGKSIYSYQKEISELSTRTTVISINFYYDLADMIYVSKTSAYELVKDCKKKIVASSNIRSEDEGIILVNYENFNISNGVNTDISAIAIINLLYELEVKKIVLAGFDGFKRNMDDNYCEDSLKRPINLEIAENRNKLIKEHIRSMRGKIDIEFLTPSIYYENE